MKHPLLLAPSLGEEQHSHLQTSGSLPKLGRAGEGFQ